MKLKMQHFLTWYDRYGLLVITGFLLAFIPLYPKIPLFSPIEEYVVRVRLEDIAIGLALVLTTLQIIRKKAFIHRVVLVLMSIYLLFGFLSILNSIFVIKMIPLQLNHIGKTVLHFFRYFEYFSVFFIASASLKRQKDIFWLVGVVAVTVGLVAIYGYMQKFFYWPVYSTMNREYSKGVRLVLTEYARIQSTFAGHYDMAAYLVITLPLVLSSALFAIRKKTKLIFFFVFLAGFWLMVMSASRIPFAASLISIFLVVVLHALTKSSIKQKLLTAVQNSFIFGIFLLTMLFYFGHDMLNRVSNLISTADHPILLSEVIDDFLSPLPIPKSQQLIAWLPKSKRPTVPTAPAPDLEQAIIAQVATINDQMPIPAVTGIQETLKPRDVIMDIPEPLTVIEQQEDGSSTMTIINRPRVYSDCALKHELSLCIRLESLWPWAWQSFSTSPLFGTGYATLNKQFIEEFTFVDGTDNNYLRTLGETGLLGFISFYGVVLYILFKSISSLLVTQARVIKMLAISLISATIGLLINASYIDVFAASKVAYTYWLISGMTLAAFHIYSFSFQTSSQIKDKSRLKKRKIK